MPDARRDKTTGLPLPSPVVPATFLCFKMTIPNALEYRTALKGILSDLGRAWTWSQTVGQDNNDAYEAAALWRAAIAQAVFEEDCEADMSCADVANCIETDAGTQAALAAAVIGSDVVNSYFNTTNTVGVPMLTAAAAASLTAAADCDFDKLFGSITSIVQQLNTNNVDFLEQLEIESNTIERTRDLFAAIPLFETLPVDDTLNYLETVMGEIKENYDATVTTALIDEYRCDLFCAAKEDPECAVSFDTLIAYFEGRLGASFDPDTIFLSFVEYFTTGTWTGTQIVDVMMLGQLAIWRAASTFLGLSLRTLQVVGAIGANDPDPDWELICEDCPPPEGATLYNLNSGTYELQSPVNPVEFLGGTRYRATTWTGNGDNSLVIASGYVGGPLPPESWPLFDIFNITVTEGTGVPPGGNLNDTFDVSSKYIAWNTAQGPHTIEFDLILN